MNKTIDPNEFCMYKKNPAFYIMADAFLLFESAKKAREDENKTQEQSFSRAAILFFPVALEAVVNVVYQYYEVYEKEQLEKIPIKNKWLEISQKCLSNMGVFEKNGEVVHRPGDVIESFSENLKIFQQYLELKNIRNEVVHLKPNFIEIRIKDIEQFEKNPELYPLTKIPKEISNWNFQHARIAKSIFVGMITKLDKFMKGSIDWPLKHPAFIEIITE